MLVGPPLREAREAYKLLPFSRDDNPKECLMFKLLVMLLSGLGAGLILAALAFVSLLIGVLVNAMVALFAGPVIDRMLEKKAT